VQSMRGDKALFLSVLVEWVWVLGEKFERDDRRRPWPSCFLIFGMLRAAKFSLRVESALTLSPLNA